MKKQRRTHQHGRETRIALPRSDSPTGGQPEMVEVRQQTPPPSTGNGERRSSVDRVTSFHPPAMHSSSEYPGLHRVSSGYYGEIEKGKPVEATYTWIPRVGAKSKLSVGRVARSRPSGRESADDYYERHFTKDRYPADDARKVGLGTRHRDADMY